MPESLKPGDPPLRREILREHTSTRPVIWVMEEDGIRFVVKDFSRNGFWFRTIVGRFLVWRERKALKALAGIEGVPALCRVMDGPALVMEFLPGRSIENLELERKLPETFFDSLEDLVDRVHARGVAHCDLKRASNTIVGPEEAPYLIDWGASISRSEFRVFPLDLIYRRFLRDDHMSIIKLKLRHRPGAVSAREKEQYHYRGPAERAVRAVRDRLRAMLQKIA